MKLKSKKKKRQVSVRVRKRIVPHDYGAHHKVWIDSNEGHRITFPPTLRWKPPGQSRSGLITLSSKGINLGRLDQGYGDYAMEGYVHVSAIERKGKMSELWRNVSTGKLSEQLTNLKRLTKHPYLLLDIPLPELYGTGCNANFREADPTPTVLDTVMGIANKIGVPILGPVSARGTNTRRILGEYLVRIMLSHIKGEKYVPYAELRTQTR